MNIPGITLSTRISEVHMVVNSAVLLDPSVSEVMRSVERAFEGGEGAGDLRKRSSAIVSRSESLLVLEPLRLFGWRDTLNDRWIPYG
mgnify:CR=1 FL=1